MKVEQIILQEQDKLEVSIVKPARHEKYFERKKIQAGHIVFEIDTKLLKTRVADMSDPRLEIVPKINFITKKISGYTTQEVRDIKANNHCVYIPALNKKNALKKFMQLAIKEMEAATR